MSVCVCSLLCVLSLLFVCPLFLFYHPVGSICSDLSEPQISCGIRLDIHSIFCKADNIPLAASCTFFRSDSSIFALQSRIFFNCVDSGVLQISLLDMKPNGVLPILDRQWISYIFSYNGFVSEPCCRKEITSNVFKLETVASQLVIGNYGYDLWRSICFWVLPRWDCHLHFIFSSNPPQPLDLNLTKWFNSILRGNLLC